MILAAKVVADYSNPLFTPPRYTLPMTSSRQSSAMGLDYRNSLPAPTDRFESHEVRDKRIQDAMRPFDRSLRVGWPIVALTLGLAATAIATLFYLFVCPSLLT